MAQAWGFDHGSIAARKASESASRSGRLSEMDIEDSLALEEMEYSQENQMTVIFNRLTVELTALDGDVSSSVLLHEAAERLLSSRMARTGRELSDIPSG